MAHDFINPLDLKKIFVDYFLGSNELFIYAFMILISFVCAKFGMSNRLFLIVLAVSSLIMAGVLGQAVYILIIFIIGFVAFKAIGKIVT